MSTSAAVREIQAIQAAQRDVSRYVTPVLACDSAAGVYKAALAELGHDVSEVHPSGLRAVWEALRQGGKLSPDRRRIAADSSSGAGFRSRFPDAAKIKAI